MPRRRDGPDQLEGVVDEAGPVVAGQHRVVVPQQVDDGPPAAARVVDHVVAAHVHVELHPVHLPREVEDVCGGGKTGEGEGGERSLSELRSGDGWTPERRWVTRLCLEEEALDGAGAAGHVGQGDLPLESVETQDM